MEQYEYDGIETCAADGSCLLSCPVGIDTGKLIKDFRNREHDEKAERSALKAAKRWAGVERAARMALRTGSGVSRALGDGPLRAVTRAQRRFVSSELMPEWGPGMPRAASPRLPETARDGAAAVYVPVVHQPDVRHVEAGQRRRPGDERRRGHGRRLGPGRACRCGSRRTWPGTAAPFPGAPRATAKAMPGWRTRWSTALWRWTDEGELTVVIDASSCTHGITSELDRCADRGER